MRTIDDMVRMEVHYCVSTLVSTVAGGYGDHQYQTFQLRQLAEQAFELCSPLQDFEEAAIQAGYVERRAGEWTNAGDDMDSFAESAQEICERDGIEPYEREIFEHWIVSDWLAEKLAAEGERVDMDFAGLTVWGRTTTGQGIAQDYVIGKIYAATHK